MFSVAAFRLCERRPRDGGQARGLSCDEEGIYLAGEIPLVTYDIDASGRHIDRDLQQSLTSRSLPVMACRLISPVE